jgi:hypothetical protein
MNRASRQKVGWWTGLFLKVDKKSVDEKSVDETSVDELRWYL